MIFEIIQALIFIVLLLVCAWGLKNLLDVYETFTRKKKK